MTGHIRKRGKTWSYMFDVGKIDGKRKQKEKGGFKTKKDASKALKKALDDFEHAGGSLREEKITLADFMAYWIANYVSVNLKYRTLKKYEMDIKNHIVPELGYYYLKNLNHEVLQTFFKNKAEHLSKNSLHALYSTLSSAFNRAHKWGYITINPLKLVTLPKQHAVNAIKTLRKDEIKTLLQYFKDSHFYLPLMIGLHTGLRAGEIVALQWSDINFKTNTLIVRHTLQYENKTWVLKEPKTTSSKRNIVMNQSLIQELKRQKVLANEKHLRHGPLYTPSDFVNTKDNGDLITLNTLKYVSKVIKERLNIPFKFHYLRHTHATLLLESSVHPKIVQERLGHSKIATTLDVYSHVSVNMQEKAMDLFEAALE